MPTILRYMFIYTAVFFLIFIDVSVLKQLNCLFSLLFSFFWDLRIFLANLSTFVRSYSHDYVLTYRL